MDLRNNKPLEYWLVTSVLSIKFKIEGEGQSQKRNSDTNSEIIIIKFNYL